jgi:ATP adenylyltransferase
MQHLWSPWRRKYVEGDSKQDGCAFCREAQQPDGPINLILFRGIHAFVILNRFPYTNGHLMVVANAHLPSFDLLDVPARSEMMELVNASTLALYEVYHPAGFNIGANIGSAAGAGIADHVHIHVVPRWHGDTNFMSTLGETRVLPEELEYTYQRLSEVWPKLNPNA